MIKYLKSYFHLHFWYLYIAHFQVTYNNCYLPQVQYPVGRSSS